MSGGHFNYNDSALKGDIFGYSSTPWNALEDHEISYLVWDVLDLIHAFDYYKSADTCEETYKESVQEFKQKWFKVPRKERLTEYIAEVFSKARDECLSMIGAHCYISVDNYGEYVDKSTAARLLGISRQTVYTMIRDGRLQTNLSGKKVSVQSISDYMTKKG